MFSYAGKPVNEGTQDEYMAYYATVWNGYQGTQYFGSISEDAAFTACDVAVPEGVSLAAIRQSMENAAQEIYDANLNAPWENGGIYLDGAIRNPNDGELLFTMNRKGSYTIKQWAFTGNPLYSNTSNPAQCFGAIKIESANSGITGVTLKIGEVTFDMAVGDTLDASVLDIFFPFGNLPKPEIGSCYAEGAEPEDRIYWPTLHNVVDETYPWGNMGKKWDLKIEIVGFTCKKLNKSAAPTAAVNAYENNLPEELK